MFTLQTSFQPLLLNSGRGERGLWAPVLLWNPAILFLKNIIKSVKKSMLTLIFKLLHPNTHVYQHNSRKMLQCTCRHTGHYNLHYCFQSRKATVYHSGRENQGCCVQGHKKHNCNTNEGCTYQGQNNQGLHFTGIAINSRDVFFKDRFMLAP
jgi:hypothetical protein